MLDRLSVFIFCVIVIFCITSCAPVEQPKKFPSGDFTDIKPIAAADLPARLRSAVTHHLDLLIDTDGQVADLKGKSAESLTLMAFEFMHELTGDPAYRSAALQLADRVLAKMKAMKFGVIYIKENETEDGRAFPSGGPPAFGWYTAALARIYHKAGGRDDDIRYIATVIDSYPWNEEGWWASTIDVNTGVPKHPISKPSSVNKTAAVSFAAAVVSDCVKSIDPALAARLKQKSDRCVSSQVLPAQEPDGFWHYGLNGNDPSNKDTVGYFMVTMESLIQIHRFTDASKDASLKAALDKGSGFAIKCIFPMTAPNTGPACPKRATPTTPALYTPETDPKRAFQLGLILVAHGDKKKAATIMAPAIRHFPAGELGQDGAHAVFPSALMLYLLTHPTQP